MEDIPRRGTVEWRLWLMGFDAEEREKLLEIARSWHKDPVELGAFAARMRERSMAEMVQMAGRLQRELQAASWWERAVQWMRNRLGAGRDDV